MNNISDLKPSLVWQYFEEITKIPRESKHEENIIQFMLDFAKKHNLEVKKDKVGNVLIKKSATKGKENLKSVCFQSHLDMVCTANKDVKIDFRKDPITAYIDGEWVKAKGTSLGADDGIGVAMSMAILTDKNLEHGPVECLFTIDEETGLTGAFALESGFFDSKILINLDSEEEGQIYIGCAGGIDVQASFNYLLENVPKDSISYKFVINGLKGGHSGDEIHKGLGNANKIANRFLSHINDKYQARLSEFDGGDRHNAIPRFADFSFTVKKTHKKNIIKDFEKFVCDIKNEYGSLETAINIELTEMPMPEFVMDFDTQICLTDSLYICPNGVHAMSLDIPGLVETSNNLATVKFRDENGKLLEADIEWDEEMEEYIKSNEEIDIEEDDAEFAGYIYNEFEVPKSGRVQIGTSQRSSIESGKNDINTMVKLAFETNGADVTSGDGYPGWKPNPNSEILDIAKSAYVKLFNKEPLVKAIHAGLECGLFLEKYQELDMISIGPTLQGVHSPDEKIEIATVQMWHDHIVEILKNIPKK
ncbi:MAG: aminoacyl-histidine dipeptidase [Bacteroidales bacterium]|jgi:dipeptidase D|nr:aminoacyl-histidine dipeptidase [Bacteroidales bacterium]